jgi:hypothetical protein
MGNWTGIVIFLTIAFPLLFGILSLLVGKKHLKHLHIVLIVSLFIFSILILVQGSFELNTGLSFFFEPITFSFSSTPNILFLIVIIILGIKLLESDQQSNKNLLRFHSLILSVSLSFGFVAFFSGVFMIRYIALEIVGLMVALTTLDSFSNIAAYTRFGAIFLILRLGDIGLWSSILILQNHMGTLNISQMIDTATGLPVQSRLWVLAGFLFAILVKTAAWPLGIWLQFIETKEASFVHWVSKILMPSLGLYLLYRVLPIIQSQPTLDAAIAISVLILTSILILTHLFGWIYINQNLLYFTLTTGMAIYLSAFVTAETLAYYLWMLMLLRLPWILKINLDKKWGRIGNALFLLSLNTIFTLRIWQNLPPNILIGWLLLSALTVFWYGMSYIQTLKLAKTNPNGSKSVHAFKVQADRLLRILPNAIHQAITGFSQRFEINFINYAFPFFSRVFTQSASLAKKHFENNLERLWQSCVKGIVKISEATFTAIEGSFDGLWDTTSDGIVKLSESTLGQIEEGGSKKTVSLIQNVISGLDETDERMAMKSFRWDLIWIPVFLVIVLIFVLTS